MKFTNLKISRECIFPIDNVAHVRLRKTFYHISVNFRNPGFRLVSNPQKLVFLFKPGPTTNIRMFEDKFFQVEFDTFVAILLDHTIYLKSVSQRGTWPISI